MSNFLHYWIDRSGSIPEKVTAAVAADHMINENDKNTAAITAFSHVLGPACRISSIGENITSLTDWICTLDTTTQGGTDFEPIYSHAEQDVFTQHIIVTDLQWLPSPERAENHPRNVSYLVPDILCDNKQIQLFRGFFAAGAPLDIRIVSYGLLKRKNGLP